MSSISTGTTTTTGYVVASDTTGALVLKTGASATTAVTVGSDQSVTFVGSQTLSGGTANGVTYLNGSKVLTSGSALTFDGTTIATTGKFGITGNGSIPTVSALEIGTNGAGTRFRYNVPTGGEHNFTENGSVISFQTASAHGWYVGGSEQMRLTTTGLGIGTSSPAAKLDVNGGANSDIRVTTSGSGYLQLGQFTNGAFIGTSSTDATAGVLRLGTGGTTRATLDSSGDLLIGTTTSGFSTGTGAFFRNASSSNTYLGINHNSASTSGADFIAFGYNGTQIGGISQSGTTAVLYNTTSDQRLKENIVDAPEFGSVIDSIKVRSYDWKSDGSHQRAGFIAQELVTVAPEAVHQPEDTEEMMAVDYSKLVPMLVKEIQSLRKRLAALEAS